MFLFFAKRKATRVFFVFSFIFMSCLWPAFAGEAERINKFVFDTVPLNLEEITETAGRIFSGTCLKAENIIENDLSVVKYTFKITEAIKGTEEKEIVSFKQWASLGKDAAYTEGQKYLLFLYPESRKGLTSPVGFLQGQFEVKKDPTSGAEAVRNKFGNVGLTKNILTEKTINLNNYKLNAYLEDASDNGDFIKYKEFVTAVKTLAGNKK